jgi:LSD1 subclass zinc finger protein
MRLGHAKRHLPMNTGSLLLQAEALGTALVLLFLAFMVAALVAFVLVAIWLYNDCRRRGESAGLWLTLYIVLGFTTIFGAAIILVIYLLARSKEIKYDQQGNLLVPAAPYYAQPMQPQWQPQPPASPGYAMPPPPATSSYAQPAPMQSPAPAQAWIPPTLSKVRCPRCRTVFEYQRQPVGQTHVKCTACGEEGNI